MAEMSQSAIAPEEAWAQIGKRLWDEILPDFLRPKYGEVFILLTIHDGKLVKARGSTECGVRYEGND